MNAKVIREGKELSNLKASRPGSSPPPPPPPPKPKPPPNSSPAQAGAVAAWLITWNDGAQSVGFDPCHEDDGTCVPLYTTPPAAVSVEALEGLVSGWLTDAEWLEADGERVRANDLRRRADELTQLIERSKELIKERA